jgi:hypothetical protein
VVEVVVTTGIDPLRVIDAPWVVGVWASGNVSGKDSLGGVVLLLGVESFWSVGDVALSLEELESAELAEGLELVADSVSDGRALSVNVGRIPGR